MNDSSNDNRRRRTLAKIGLTSWRRWWLGPIDLKVNTRLCCRVPTAGASQETNGVSPCPVFISVPIHITGCATCAFILLDTIDSEFGMDAVPTISVQMNNGSRTDRR